MKKIYVLLLGAALFFACDDDNASLDPAPDEEDPTVEIEVRETGSANVYILSTNVSSTFYTWDTGKGDNRSLTGNNITIAYPQKGTYTVTLTYRDANTYETRKRTTTFTVAADNDDMIAADADPLLYKISGGSGYPFGKTWVVDSTATGHLANGSSGAMRPDWWQADPYAKVGEGVYDDRLTLDYRKGVVYENHGTTFVLETAVDEMRQRPGATILDDNGSGDKQALYTPGDDWTWSVESDGDRDYLVFPDGEGFAIFYTASPHRYEILEITDDYMYLRQEIDWIAYYFRLIREGWDGQSGGDGGDEGDHDRFVYEDFEGDSFFNLGFENDHGQSALGVENPYPGGINNSAHVGKYYKSTEYYTRAAWYMGEPLDLNKYWLVRMKVYFPSSNDYTTVNNGEDWLGENTQLRNAVFVKFQNGDAEEPWNDQIQADFWDLELDTWHDLTFDFSMYKGRENMNIFILQFGNEGHDGTGTFYFDDVEIYGIE